MSGVVRRPSPAMVVGLTALFVALSGSSYAAIKANSVGAKQIKADAVRTAEVQDDGIGNADLADDSVSAAQIQDGTVGPGEIGDGALSGADLQQGSLSGAEIGDESLSGADVDDESLTGADVDDESLTGADIQDDSVGAAEIGNGSLTGEEIDDGTIAAGELAPGVVPEQVFARVNGTVTGAAGAPAAPALQPNVVGFPPQNKGIVASQVVRGEGAAATGNYCFNIDGRPSSAMVTLDNADAAAADRNLVASVAIDRGEDLGDCPAAHNDARVRIVDAATEAATNARFFIWFTK